QLQGDRSQAPDRDRSGKDWLPFATLHLAAAGEDQRTSYVSRRMHPFAAGHFHAFTDRSEDAEAPVRSEDPAGHGNPVDGVADRHAPLGYAFDELPSAVQWIDDPNPVAVQTRRIVGSLLRQPPLSGTRKCRPKSRVDGDVRLSHRIVPGLHGRLDLPGGERSEGLGGPIQGGGDSSQDPFHAALILRQMPVFGAADVLTSRFMRVKY